MTEDGEHIKIPKYILWCHDLKSQDWSINGYKQLCSINNISEFWRLFNNFKKIGWKHFHFYFMKSGVKPRWEDNKEGGELSFCETLDSALYTWEKLGVYLIAEKLYTEPEKIKGLSINIKKDHALIKIWISEKNSEALVKHLKTISAFENKNTHFVTNETKLSMY